MCKFARTVLVCVCTIEMLRLRVLCVSVLSGQRPDV